MAVKPVHAFVARNTAAASENRIHDAETAARYGVRSALVPATALLPHLLAAAAETCRFGELPDGSATVRFLAPVFDREQLRVADRSGGVLDLVDSRDQVVATGTFSNDTAGYGSPCASYVPGSGDRRALTTDGLMADERLAPLVVDCSDDEVSRYLSDAGLDPRGPATDVAFLVSQVVPFLRHNFAREQPSLYVGVDLLIGRPPSLRTSLEMRGRIDRLFTRRGRKYVVFETAWFDANGHGHVWARHTVVYDIGQRRGVDNASGRI